MNSVPEHRTATLLVFQLVIFSYNALVIAFITWKSVSFHENTLLQVPRGTVDCGHLAFPRKAVSEEGVFCS